MPPEDPPNEEGVYPPVNADGDQALLEISDGVRSDGVVGE